MSWTRWGSSCGNSWPPHPANEVCKDCPGSTVYVYESDKGFECCGCNRLGDFTAKTRRRMKAHLKWHVSLGDHVRPSLLLTDKEYLRQLKEEDNAK